jgi:hypothetical protein
MRVRVASVNFLGELGDRKLYSCSVRTSKYGCGMGFGACTVHVNGPGHPLLPWPRSPQSPDKHPLMRRAGLPEFACQNQTMVSSHS